MLVCKSMVRNVKASQKENIIQKEETQNYKHWGGDSHGRDSASKVKYELDNTFEIHGIIKPRADLMPVIKQQK
jgi:hypothetical protein